jgi:hypothetical protein
VKECVECYMKEVDQERSLRRNCCGTRVVFSVSVRASVVVGGNWRAARGSVDG